MTDSLRAMVLRAYGLCVSSLGRRRTAAGGKTAPLRPGSARAAAKSLTSVRVMALGRSTPRSPRKEANCWRSVAEALMVRML